MHFSIPSFNFSGIKRVFRSVPNFLKLVIGTYPLEPKTPEELAFPETEEYEKGFSVHHAEHVIPEVADFENKRIAALKKIRKRSFIVLPASIAVTVLGVFAGAYIGSMDILGIALMGIIALVWWNHKPSKDYKTSIKEKIYPHFLSFYGEGLTYAPERSMDMQRLARSDILPSYNQMASEDYIRGRYQGVDLELAEKKLIKIIRTNKGRRRKTVFKGMCIFFSVHKPFKGKTIVVRDKGRALNWLKDKFTALEKVALEDPIFEKKFEVYSSDQIEARYLLTTSFMQRLLDLAEVFDGTNVQCSFYEEYLLLMIPVKKNLFEPGSIFHPALSVQDLKILLKELHLVFQIIEILKLNQNIGL